MEERNENNASNGEWQERKELPKMAKTRAKAKRMDMKTLVKPEHRRKKWEDSITGEKEKNE